MIRKTEANKHNFFYFNCKTLIRKTTDLKQLIKQGSNKWRRLEQNKAKQSNNENRSNK